MEFRNLTPFDALCFNALGVDDQEYPVLAMKVGYRLLPVDSQPGQLRAEVMDVEPVALCTDDAYYGEEGTSSVNEESDLAPFKPRCDVIVVGLAHAPQGLPSKAWNAGIRLSVPIAPVHTDVPLPEPLSPGAPLSNYLLQEWQARRNLLDKQLRFSGPRQFKDSLLDGWQLTQAQPVLSVPLRWEYAFGGSSVVRNPEHLLKPDSPEYLLNEVCYSNPLGSGWIEKRQEQLGFKLDAPLRELPAPQIEAIDWPVLHLDKATHPDGLLDAIDMMRVASTYKYQPAGFGVVDRTWAPRLALAGNYDAVWQAERWPGLPYDFDFAYWNGAPTDQQIEFPPPNLRIELFNLTDPNLTPNGYAQVEMPGHRAFVLLRLFNGALLPLPMLTDTLRIDTEAMTLVLTHRISLPNNLDIRVLEARFETDPAAQLIKRSLREVH